MIDNPGTAVDDAAVNTEAPFVEPGFGSGQAAIESDVVYQSDGFRVNPGGDTEGGAMRMGADAGCAKGAKRFQVRKRGGYVVCAGVSALAT